MRVGAAWGWAWLIPIGVLTWLLTDLMRRYALGRRMVDIPNARSSHSVATPRGGGGAIVVVLSATFVWWWWSGAPDAMSPTVIVASLIVAGVGFIDDHRHVAPLLRLAAHAVAAWLAVTSLGGAAWGPFATVTAVVGAVWLINLTNFMDGVDGIAGAQIVTVCMAGGGLLLLEAPDNGLWREPAAAAAATAGFLVWNWPPARIFMGDVGSGYVGFMVAVLALRAAAIAPALGWSWIILFGVFIVDATVTLLRRAARRHRLFEAHRSHVYQHLARRASHRFVTWLVIGLNGCWLMPLAYLVSSHRTSPVWGLLLAYLPLTVAALQFGPSLDDRP